MKVVFKKVGKFAGSPDEPTISIATQDLGNQIEVSATCGQMVVRNGYADKVDPDAILTDKEKTNRLASEAVDAVKIANKALADKEAAKIANKALADKEAAKIAAKAAMADKAAAKGAVKVRKSSRKVNTALSND